jgi:hypothetical protein
VPKSTLLEWSASSMAFLAYAMAWSSSFLQAMARQKVLPLLK